MKTLIPYAILLLTSKTICTQNILEALDLKNDLIGAYLEGETMSTDTIIDLKNAYYEEFYTSGEFSKIILRQATLFRNIDASTTLGISTSSWDFQCYVYETKFYTIPKQRDSIILNENIDILPKLNIRDFLVESTIFPIISKYLAAIQENYLDASATIDDVLSELYDIVYILPREGRNVVATLKLCDYIPTNIVTISPSDWSILEHDFTPIVLEYDGKKKKFRQP